MNGDAGRWEIPLLPERAPAGKAGAGWVVRSAGLVRRAQQDPPTALRSEIKEQLDNDMGSSEEGRPCSTAALGANSTSWREYPVSLDVRSQDPQRP